MRTRQVRGAVATIAAFILFGLAAGTALGHDVQAIQGTVDCDGNYSISVTGDVYGGVHLIVKLDGTTIYDQAQNGSSAVQTFGPFTGTGGYEGEAIFAKSGDESDANGSSGALVLSVQSCETPTPSPTPTVTPSPTPVVTPTPSATPTATPAVTASPTPSATPAASIEPTPQPSIPNTALSMPSSASDWGVVLILAISFIVLGMALFRELVLRRLR